LRETRVRKLILWCHRWLGTAFCLLFCLWFLSAFGMMYWDYPEVGAKERLQRGQVIDASRVVVPPDRAFAALGLDRDPSQVRLVMFDGRPAYRFRAGRRPYLVYADNGAVQPEFSRESTLRTAAAWTGQPPGAAKFEGVIGEPDQWTLGGARALRPFDKYSWPDGEEVYVSQGTGEVAQYTTTASRWGAYLGPIPHWLYFTPLRRNGRMWTNLVVWLSGAGVVASLLGLIGGLWIYAPARRIPYTGLKRWHMIFGLVFGLIASTWVFSGLLSMEPFDALTQAPETGPSGLLRESPSLGSFRNLPPLPPGVKELELTQFDGQPVYLATNAPGQSQVLALDGTAQPQFDRGALLKIAAAAADPYRIAESRDVDRYEAYYVARHGELPLPALFVRLDDPRGSIFYIDPKTARVVASYTSASRWNRWLYHGLHSWDLPWLYRNRPAWDILVLAMLSGGTVISVMGAVIGWNFLRRSLVFRPHHSSK